MRNLTTLALLMLAGTLVPCSGAQSLSAVELREQAKENDVKHDELVNLEKQTVRALQSKNVGLFQQIYGDDFVGILPSGRTVDKAGWIATVENSAVKYDSSGATDIRVRVFEQTAVVTCLWSLRGTENGHPFSRQLRVTHVYFYGQRGWQAIAGQETLLPG